MFSSLLNSVLFAIVLSSATTYAAPSLSMQVSGPDAAQKATDMKFVTTITNTGDEAVDLLNEPGSVLFDLPTNQFRVTGDSGADPEFAGVVVKYAYQNAIDSGDVTTIAPGQTITVERDLSEAYDFAKSGAGRYTFSPNTVFHAVDRTTKEVSIIEAAVDKEHVTQISGKLIVAPNKTLRRRAAFRSCSAEQQGAINQAIPAALRYSYDTASYLQSTGDTPRYRTWFGAFTQARHNTVLDHFTKIYNSNFNTYTYDCSCARDNVYAYVYPDRFREMWLCPVFWRAPVTGTDSKGGTLVHESSHYTANGGTKDYAYGQANAQALARNNPDQAVFNADSHEYLAENNPPLA
ncbi:hypothetical protein AMATHDRAFT_197192 [Amanita thiersii Skay4041]|uniref:Lysine-specific metallo-endopeptidase domain-containing protein n=1 Tax=Amanita thiersii Skay4041 TaxID=703135 RepID=A0A2A9NK19_9AGAR|nr:hypothetical protein AMATHDRAFT_197192 [Amanita thiersii Skay4041]